MKESTAAIVGFLVAPVLPALVLGGLAGFTRVGDPIVAIGLFPVFYWFAILFTALLGMPAFFLARRFRLIRWWSSAIVGFSIGAAVPFVVAGHAPVKIPTVIGFAAMGAASALIFWIIWERRSPKSET